MRRDVLPLERQREPLIGFEAMPNPMNAAAQGLRVPQSYLVQSTDDSGFGTNGLQRQHPEGLLRVDFSTSPWQTVIITHVELTASKSSLDLVKMERSSWDCLSISMHRFRALKETEMSVASEESLLQA